MIDKVQKIREEVERLKSNLIHGACASQIAMETRCKEEAYDEVLAILDTIQEEPVSEDLEKAANEWNAKASFTPFYMTLDNKGNPNGVKQDYTTHAESFKAGAEWQKEQMMTKSIEAVVSQVPCSNEIILYNPSSVDKYYLPQEMNKLGLNKGDKVKLVIIKVD